MARRHDGTRIRSDHVKKVRGMKQAAKRLNIPLRQFMRANENETTMEWLDNKVDAGRRLYQTPKAGQKKRATVKKSWHKKKVD